VKNGRNHDRLSLAQPLLGPDALQLYRWMHTARRIDDLEREFVARGEAFFQVSSAGHEASASLAQLLLSDDYLHCHYRDKALMHARGIPIGEFFDSLLCNASSHSSGRQMSAHMSGPTLNILSLVGPVGNNALQAAGVAHQIKPLPTRPIVVCCFGDGTSQQGEVLEAIAESVRWQLPVLFLIEDNHYSISTRTAGKTFYSTPNGNVDLFYGLPIHSVDGSDVAACHDKFGLLIHKLRETRSPAICVMRVERLTDHTNADDEGIYRDPEEIRRVRAADPLSKLRAGLLAHGVSEGEIVALEKAIDAEVRAAAEAALDHAPPRPITDAKLPIPVTLTDRNLEYRGTETGERLAMRSAVREALRSRMSTDPRVTLYGQDIEDPKGDVFGLTLGLSTAFPGRVMNSPLSESTILGTSIGRALAGGRPVAFLQFADFLPLAFNQLANELGSLAWRTNGAWKAPVIVLATCGGYRPGLGPFHAGTFESIVAHVPGVDVAVSSTAADAVGMLNAAFRSERPTVLFYPKALLNDPTRSTSCDVERQFVPVGAARIVRVGSAITLIGWGNAVPLCEKVASTLATAGLTAEVIDLRWLSPWDKKTVCNSVRKTSRLLVAHEDNLTTGFGAEVVATVSECVGHWIDCRRVARPDTYIPCHFGNQLEVLPSYRSILTMAAEMCGLDLRWKDAQQADLRRQIVSIIGSSPADQSVVVVELLIKVGDTVTAGQTIASFEADKAVVELAAPADGTIENIYFSLGDRAPVGAPFVTLRLARTTQRQPTNKDDEVAHIRHLPAEIQKPQTTSRQHNVVLTGLTAVRGRARLHNAELGQLLRVSPAEKPNGDRIFERTGIESRLVADQSQDTVSMAAEAAAAVLAKVGIKADELNLVICSTTTPTMISPSTACQVLYRLALEADFPAYDLQAACTGYLYALTAAWDYLQYNPSGNVLVLTTETMRRVVDIGDPDTSPIFGDAATATLLTTSLTGPNGLALLRRPVVSAHGESGSTLNVPIPQPGAYVRMDGKRIFTEAVRRMPSILAQACAQSNLTINDLDLVVPHQANGRIIEAIRTRLKLPQARVWNELRMQGNTSSSSIPLALETILYEREPVMRIGLCAFGAGYTFGAAILDRSGPVQA
jgi:2-oxoisovalerate dehydrogenase E1 component